MKILATITVKKNQVTHVWEMIMMNGNDPHILFNKTENGLILLKLDKQCVKEHDPKIADKFYAGGLNWSDAFFIKGG